MPRGSEATKDYPIVVPPIEKRDFKVVKGGLTEKEKKPVSEKVQKKIAQKVSACIAAGFVASSGGFIALGETGNLPEQVQEWYDNTADSVRALFGIEIVNETVPTTPVETTPPTVKETVPPTTETTKETPVLKEFEASMIKNRLVFSGSARTFGAAHHEATISFEPGAPVPLWYLYDQETIDGKTYSYMASGVIAGEFKREIGETGKEELFLPVAFQDPTTGKFFVRDLSFGDSDFFEAREAGPWGTYIPGGIATCFLDNYTYLGMEGGHIFKNEHFEELEKNFQVGDQIAFSLLTELNPTWDDKPPLEGVDPNYLKIIDNFLNTYYPNSKLFYEAMKENKELPELKISPWVILVNKLAETEKK